MRSAQPPKSPPALKRESKSCRICFGSSKDSASRIANSKSVSPLLNSCNSSNSLNYLDVISSTSSEPIAVAIASSKVANFARCNDARCAR